MTNSTNSLEQQILAAKTVGAIQLLLDLGAMRDNVLNSTRRRWKAAAMKRRFELANGVRLPDETCLL